jgi:hypothetical protein
MDEEESSRVRRLASLKRKQLAALLSSSHERGIVSSAVKTVKSAVDIRAKPQKNKPGHFPSRRSKSKE